MTTIDFAAITTSPNYQEELKSLHMSGKKKSAVVYAGMVFLFIFPLTLPFMLVWAISKIPAGYRRQKQDVAAAQAFAQANGFQYRPPLPNVQWGAQPEHIMDVQLPYKDAKVDAQESISGTLDGWKFEYTNAFVRHVQPDGQVPPQAGGMTANIFRLQLPISMPTLLANSRFNNLPGLQPRPDNFTNEADFRLEGDFPQYYTVQAEKSDRIPAIAVLSPEVMQALKDNHYFDLWVHGQDLVLLTQGVNFFPTIPDAFKTVQVMMREIDLIARRLAHEHATTGVQ